MQSESSLSDFAEAQLFFEAKLQRTTFKTHLYSLSYDSQDIARGYIFICVTRRLKMHCLMVAFLILRFTDCDRF